MATNFGDTSFSSGGRKFNLIANLIDDNSSKVLVALDPNQIDMFEYVNQLNQLVLSGQMIYTDLYGEVDKVIDEQNAYCHIIFNERIQKSDNTMSLEADSKTEKFEKTFILSNIEIVSRREETIVYKFSLVDINWIKCVQNITYSNYDRQPESILDIIANCMIKCGMKTSTKSFGKESSITTPVKMNFITSGNDNLFTIKDFLMNRLFYYQTYDDGIKFIAYHQQDDNFKIVDLTTLSDNKLENGQDVYPVVLSFFKTNSEKLLAETGVKIGTVVKTPKTKTFVGMFNRLIYDYDYSKNIITSQTLDSESIINYINKFPDSQQSAKNQKKYKTLQNFSENKFFSRTSYWQANHIDMYQKTVDTILGDNSLVINIPGEVNRNPGAIVITTVDRNIKFVLEEDPKDLDRIRQAYSAFDGMWIISKVRNFISPKNKSFTQNLVIFRNFKNKRQQQQQISSSD